MTSLPNSTNRSWGGFTSLGVCATLWLVLTPTSSGWLPYLGPAATLLAVIAALALGVWTDRREKESRRIRAQEVTDGYEREALNEARSVFLSGAVEPVDNSTVFRVQVAVENLSPYLIREVQLVDVRLPPQAGPGSRVMVTDFDGHGLGRVRPEKTWSALTAQIEPPPGHNVDRSVFQGLQPVVRWLDAAGRRWERVGERDPTRVENPEQRLSQDEGT